MKQWFLIVAWLVLLANARQAAAVLGPGPKVQVNGGVAIPTHPQPFSDVYSVGFGGGIGIELPATPSFEIAGNVDFTTFGLDKGEYLRANGIAPGSALVGGELSVLYLSGTLRWNVLLPPGSPLRPYVLGGAGLFRIVTDDITVAGVTRTFETESVLGVHGGGGVDVILGSLLKLFVEAVYVVGLTEAENTAYLPLRAGISLDLAPDV